MKFNSLHFKSKFWLLVTFLIMGPQQASFAQHEEFKQKIAAFVDAHAANFEKKYLNETEPKYGELNNTNFEFHDYFLLRAKEKTVNNIGNNVKLKYDYSFFAYESAEECDYALSFWFKNFLEAKRVTPGREVKTFTGANPTIIVVNPTEICVLSLSCADFDPDIFRTLRKEMLTYFGSPECMIIEVGCDGPLQWTKNPPDPKDPKWRK